MLQAPPLENQTNAAIAENRARHLRRAVERAVENVQSGMTLGLGGGSPVLLAIRRIGALLDARTLSDVVAVTCSPLVHAEATRAGITVLELDEVPAVDLALDGADEVDPELDRVHSASASLFRTRVISQSSRREIVVVDDSRRSPRLGTRAAVPVEVARFGRDLTVAWLESLGAAVEVRRNGADPVITPEGNAVYDVHFGPIERTAELAARLDARAGIAAHGLFVGGTAEVISAGDAGVRHLVRRR